jgi:hypothetical protein
VNFLVKQLFFNQIKSYIGIVKFFSVLKGSCKQGLKQG